MSQKKILIKKPLAGIRVVVTRARAQSSQFASLLKSHGAQVLCCPTIKIIPPRSFKRLDAAIGNLENYDWLIFTSVNGVEYFWKRYRKVRRKRPFPSGIRTCAIGPATAERMKQFRIVVDKISKEYVAESILKELTKVRGNKILIPRAKEAREILPETLRKRGAQVDVIPAYRTVLDRSSFSIFRKWFRQREVNCVTFTSSSTVNNFFSLLNSKEQNQILRSPKIFAASIGPVTTQSLKRRGWRPKIIAAKPTTEHLADAIIHFFKKHRKEPTQ